MNLYYVTRRSVLANNIRITGHVVQYGSNYAINPRSGTTYLLDSNKHALENGSYDRYPGKTKA